MRKVLLGTVAMAGTAMTVAMSGALFMAETLVPSDASAGTMLYISVNTNATTNTVNSGASPLKYTNSTFSGTGGGGSYSVSVTARGTPPNPQPNFGSQTIDAKLNSGAGTLYIWVTETGLTAAVSKLKSGLTVNSYTGGASQTMEATYTGTATQKYGGNVLFSKTFGTTASASQINAVTTSATYSESEEYVLTFAGAGSENLTISQQFVVPEPAS